MGNSRQYRHKVVCFWTGDTYRQSANVLKWSCDQHGIACEVTCIPASNRARWSSVAHNQLMKKKIDVILAGLNSGYNVLYLDADAYIANGREVKRVLNSDEFDGIDCAWHTFTPSDPKRAKSPRSGGLDKWPAGGTLYFADTSKARELIGKWLEQWNDHPEYSDQTRLHNALKQTTGVKRYELPQPWYQMPDDPNSKEPPVIVQGWWKKIPGVKPRRALAEWRKWVTICAD